MIFLNYKKQKHRIGRIFSAVLCIGILLTGCSYPHTNENSSDDAIKGTETRNTAETTQIMNIAGIKVEKDLFKADLPPIPGNDVINFRYSMEKCYGFEDDIASYPVKISAAEDAYQLPEQASVYRILSEAPAQDMKLAFETMSGVEMSEDISKRSTKGWQSRQGVESYYSALHVGRYSNSYYYFFSEYCPEGEKYYDFSKDFRDRYAKINLTETEKEMEKKAKHIADNFSGMTGNLELFSVETDPNDYNTWAKEQGFSPTYYQFLFIKPEAAAKYAGKKLPCDYEPSLVVTLRLDGLVTGINGYDETVEKVETQQIKLPSKDDTLKVAEKEIQDEKKDSTAMIISIEAGYFVSTDQVDMLQPYIHIFYTLDYEPVSIWETGFPASNLQELLKE